MARTLFFRMVFRKVSEITKNKPTFSQYNIFYNYEYFFFQSVFWSLLNHCQSSQSNQERYSLWCSLPCFLVLLCTHYRLLHCFLNQSFTAHIPRLCYFLWLCKLNIISAKQTLDIWWHGCSNHLNLEMEAGCLTKTLSYLNLNISKTKNGRNKL